MGIKLNRQHYLTSKQHTRNAQSKRRLKAMKSATTILKRGVHKKHLKSAAKTRNGSSGGARSKKYKKYKKFRSRPSKSTKKSNTNHKHKYFHFISL